MRKKDKYAFLGVDPLGSLLRETAEEWDGEKHRPPSAAELSMVNSIAVRACPHCLVGEPVRNGRNAGGVQTYKCKSCGRRFTPLTGTVFEDRKVAISERMEYIVHLLEDHSVVTSGRDNMNAESTAPFWLSQIFDAIEGCQEGVELFGDVWVDEYYAPMNSDEVVLRPDGKRKRGLSSNQLCISTATDGRHSVFVVCGRGNAGKDEIFLALSKHIKPGSTLHHDGDPSHARIVNELGLKSVVHLSSETKGLPDRSNPMNPINSLHAYLSHFLYNHYGFRRNRTQQWVNLFWVKVTQCEMGYMDGAKYIILRMLKTKKRHTYRKFYSKKG